MNASYWEIKTWLSKIDFTIIGSGIVGLTCAIALKDRFPKSKILILEKGMLPEGASTKNAGFACFGSVSELLDDLETHHEETVYNLVENRLKGLTQLRKLLGDKAIDYKNYGGYEYFTKNDHVLFEKCKTHINYINNLLQPLFGSAPYNIISNPFGFKNVINDTIFTAFESQIDTGKMMSTLLTKAQSKGIKILNNCSLKTFTENNNEVHLKTNSLEFKTSKLIIATNGFAKSLLQIDVLPARAQVLITKPIKNLMIKGTFHLDRGYYYFRNIDQRILLGGGRHLDKITETTTQLTQTPVIQNQLEHLLKTVILPEQDFEIDCRWSGIMGIGTQKKPIIKSLSNNVYCGVRLGGMGVALGTSVGYNLAKMIE